LQELEKKLITAALEQANFNVSECARILKINRTTLIEKINKLAISS
jgi:sigma-54 specific flagellar transcriptional regulator A